MYTRKLCIWFWLIWDCWNESFLKLESPCWPHWFFLPRREASTSSLPFFLSSLLLIHPSIYSSILLSFPPSILPLPLHLFIHLSQPINISCKYILVPHSKAYASQISLLFFKKDLVGRKKPEIWVKFCGISEEGTTNSPGGAGQSHTATSEMGLQGRGRLCRREWSHFRSIASFSLNVPYLEFYLHLSHCDYAHNYWLFHLMLC